MAQGTHFENDCTKTKRVPKAVASTPAGVWVSPCRSQLETRMRVLGNF